VKRGGNHLVSIGASIFAAGSTLAVGYYLYLLQSHHSARSFWSPPGYIAVGLLVLGAAFFIGGVTSSRDESPRQTQMSGPNSTNLLAGNNIEIQFPPPKNES
jgi:hypothetical protein